MFPSAFPFPAAIPLLVAIYGLLIGSFLNVCIYRIPLEKTVVRGRSFCPSCNSPIPWYCNIPLLSYLLLRGRCLRCKERISPIYPAVELLNALLYLAVWAVYGLTVQGFLTSAVFSALIVVAFIDLRHMIIPDGLVVFLLILGVLHTLYQIFSVGSPWHIWMPGFFAASLPLYIMGLIYTDGMGGGDIKLMAAAGLFMGWKMALLSLFAGALYGSVAALFILLAKKGSMKTAIPFGPMLSMGIVTCLLSGEKLLSWYLSLFA